jgi:hypothetical protein
MENNQQIIEQVKQEIETICEKYKITLIPVIVHQGNRTISSIEIVQIPQSAETEEQPKAE